MHRPNSPTRLRVTATLALVMTVPSLTQFALGSLAPFLVDEFDLSRSGLGSVTSGYYLAAACLSPLMGRLVDAIGVRRSLVVTVLLGWAGSLAFASSGGLVAVLASVCVAGAGTALANPATNAAISTMPRPHATLVGVKQSGVQIAALVAGSTLPVVAVAYGWRTSVLACSVAFALGVVATVTMRVGAPVSAREEVRRPITRGTLRIALFVFLMGCGMAAVNVYLVLFAHDRLGLDVRLAGVVLATTGLVAIGARIAYTLAVEHARNPDRAGMTTLRAMALAGAGAITLIATSTALGPVVLWIGAVAAGTTVAAFNGVAMLVVIRANQAPARASGVVQGAFFAGMLVSPPVFGILVDTTHTYDYAWAWAVCCVVVAAFVVPRVRR